MTSEVLKRLVEIVNQIEHVEGETDNHYDNGGQSSSQPTPNISELCQIHDALIEELLHQENRNTAAVDILQFRLGSLLSDEPKKSMGLDAERVASEADMYRAIAGISIYLLPMITTIARMDSTLIEHLRCTIRQSTLLLKMLSTIYSFSRGTTRADVDALPSHYPMLQRWRDEMEEQMNSGGSNAWGEDMSNMISFNRQNLAQEEVELLLMANTPTPLEEDSSHPNDDGMEEDFIGGIPSAGLVARMSAKYFKKETATDETTVTSSSVQIGMDHRGLIRLRDSTLENGNGWWAALTPSSTTSYHSPTFTITSVAVPKGDKSQHIRTTLSTIAVEVGRDGRQWWEATSSVIQRLNELQSLQEEVGELWSQKEVERQISAASIEQPVDASMKD